MENINHTDKHQQIKNHINDAYNDEYWNKKYGVSSDELKATDAANIPAKIIHVSDHKHHAA
jgi:hypothetical protein